MPGFFAVQRGSPLRTQVARGAALFLASLVLVLPAALVTLHLRAFARGRELTRALSETETRSEAREIGLRIRHQLLERANDLAVLAEVWGAHREDPEFGQFRRIAGTFLGDNACYHAINYVDPQSVVRATVPDSNRPHLLGRDLKELPGRAKMHADVRGNDRPLASPPVTLVGSYPGIVIWHPIRGTRTGQFHGLVAAAIKTDVLLGVVFREKSNRAFQYQIQIDGQTVFGERDAAMARGAQQETFEVLGRRWTVLARPKPGTALARIEEPLRWQLILGVALSLLTGGLLLTVVLVNRRLAAAQDRLRSSEERIRITLDSIGDAVVATDLAGRVETMNPVAEELTGWRLQEAKGVPLLEVFRVVDSRTREPVADPVQQVLASGAVVGLAKRSLLLARDGTERQIADSGAPIRDDRQRTRGVVLVFRDVTGEHALQEQLRQSQKLQAVGQLAGGVAHDFNNTLVGIMGAADLLDATVTDPKARSLCSMILESAGRASQLTQKLLAFARKRPPALASIDLHVPLRAALDLAKTALDPRVRVDLDLSAEKSVVEGDLPQLQNAFLNLFLNAAQAMANGGTLRVASRVLFVGEDDAKASPFGLKPGPHLEVEVQDSGHGIAPEHLGRIFEPFFTTKAVGEGTGLGLAMVYGTIQAHRGAITVQSEPGTGTCFHLAFPLSDSAGISAEIPAPIRGTGRILLVDDDDLARAAGKAQLERLGYEVTTAAHGLEGLRVFQSSPDAFDLVILDMAMPEMSGCDCFSALRTVRADVRVVLTSGLIQPEELDRMVVAGLRGFLAKPFRTAELSRVVHEAMTGD